MKILEPVEAYISDLEARIDVALKLVDSEQQASLSLQQELRESQNNEARLIKQYEIMRSAFYYMAYLPKIPYVFGGESLSGMDCSGYMQTVFKDNRIMLSRSSEEQFRMPSAVSVPLDKLEPCDLIFLDRDKSGKKDHVMMHLGYDVVIMTAGNPAGIEIVNYKKRYPTHKAEAKRYF